MSKAILEYYNVIIRQEDLDTLKNDAWIADTIVEFHEEYLERTVLHNFKAIKLLRPSMVYLVANIQDASELASALPPDLSSCQAVFIPVNDAADPTCPDSGSHWSLLVYARPFNSFFYYDSLGDSNLNAALAVAQKFAPLLSKVRPNFVHENDCPQQSNGADCGACVIGATDVLVNRLLQPQTPGTAFSPEAIMHLNEADVLPPATIRKTLQKVIMKFVKVANSTPGNAIRAGDSVPISTA
ncbi:unnamed protein product [Umbelopsis sp. WA50703]